MAVLIRLTVFFLVALGLSGAQASELLLPEQKIKAGLVYNFLKYTGWPEEADSVTVCLYGGDPFGGSLAPMQGRSAGKRIIALREIGNANGLPGCDLLLVNASKSKAWPSLRAMLAGKSILTISDIKGFAREGGMVEFTHADQRIQVEIDLRAVQGAKLQVQDSLLQLADVVHPAGRVSP